MSRINGDRRLPRIPSRPDRVRVPLWMLLVAVAGKGLVLGVRWCWRHRVAVPLVLVLAVFTHRAGPLRLVALLAALTLVAVGWSQVHPRSFGWLSRRVRARVRLAFVYRRRWVPAMVHTSLAIRMPASNGDQVTFDEYFPRIRSIRSTRAVDTLRVELLPGQTPEQWADQAEALRHVFRARRCQVQAEEHRYIRVHFHYRDTLTGQIRPIRLDNPGPVIDHETGDQTGGDPSNGGPAAASIVAGLSAIPIGRCEDGSPWTLPVRGTHLLVAGATGAGKGSVLWSIIRGLGPAVRAGLAELWVCDPKGGMELAFGEPLFTRFATRTEEIADLLDDAVAVMQKRTGRLRGRTRLHTPTTGEPLIVLVVDEIASLTAYVTDRDVKKRIGAALPLLLSQGRAPGVVVLAAVQDPRKEVLPFRDLFPVRVALRMTEPEQADLVLGSGARDRGARADEIPVSLPGVGYVLAEGQPEPVRVRASFIDDTEISRTVLAYRPTPALGAGWTPDLSAYLDDLPVVDLPGVAGDSGSAGWTPDLREFPGPDGPETNGFPGWGEVA
ncbi:FtsK/SpoIIIE domain-containing protein [Parafrankia sp. EUN1f]|uniref:FtsK/SpoIIIE domain-containing protein n=1 Tax=Parafrankia sp. EUN1f TaxID=102897 RepID=UPI0001C43DCB|nr:FtsK/SpoIIIE domain-containing protein [Parafrankia sp. EUN1f]EFC85958.1 cell division protein FtsK/SpoIIIE [Parafrankia sp. EUN1f]